MNYIVTCTIEYEIEAESEKEARDKAESKFYLETKTTPDYSEVIEL